MAKGGFGWKIGNPAAETVVAQFIADCGGSRLVYQEGSALLGGSPRGTRLARK